MKRVVLLGINSEVRARMEHWFSQKYAVVGYADLSEKFQKCRNFAYKKFYRNSELGEKSFSYDYLVCCEEKYNKWLIMKEELIKLGVPREKIIPTTALVHPSERVFVSTYDDFVKLNRSFQGVCFGMSYTRRGFMTHLFRQNWFKFSLGGCDLHTVELWLSHLFAEHAQLLEDTECIALEVPYYTFNWDIQYSRQIYARMLYFDEFDDYADFIANRKDAVEYIEQYHVLKDMIAERYENSSSVYTNHVFDKRRLDVISKDWEDEDFAADKIWHRRHEKTIRQNKERLARIIELCRQHKKEFVILVYPMSPSFVEHNRECFQENQEFFYQILEETGFTGKIFDLNKMEYPFLNSDFQDLTHLNTGGSNKASKILNKVFSESDIFSE